MDDRSTDATPQILAELRTRFSNLKVIDGRDPPDGWLGKPNALEIGRKEAKGQWLLFVDADVVYAPDLLSRAIAHVVREEADMLFLAPNFTTKGVMEAVLMSTIYLVGAAAFPAYLATHSKSKRFAGGGGVFNLVRRDALTACGAFESIKDAVVDDAVLGYKVKAAGLRGPWLDHLYVSECTTVPQKLLKASLRTFIHWRDNFPGFYQSPSWAVYFLLYSHTTASLMACWLDS